MNFIYCRRVYIAYKKEKSKRKVSKLLANLSQKKAHRLTRIINESKSY